MPADRTLKRSARAGPSTKPKMKKYALPPIAGAGDEADVHAAPEVTIGAVAELDDDDDLAEEDDKEEMEEGEGEGGIEVNKGKRKPEKPTKKKKTAGIVYISRLPPGMTPHKVRHLMAKWGEVGRVYAQSRDAVVGYNPDHHKKKERHKSADFTEAWVEFMDKSIAKTVASMLNAQVIGGKKGDRWRDDIWTMRYLSGFKWEMLGEQVAYERQVHQSRMRAELQRSKTEQNAYLQNVELARVLKKREERAAGAPATGRSKSSGKGAGEGAKKDGTKGKGGKGDGENKANRSYRQREVVDRAHGLAAKGMDDVLGSLF